MATTTATLTLTSDINTDALALTTTHTLNQAGTTIGLEQTTGLAKKIYAAAQSNAALISAGSYSGTGGRVYVKNTGSSSTDYFTLELGASNINIGRLYGQDIAWLPYDGTQDIDISSTGTNMELEFMVINEG